jgi:hypothetical protein
VGGVRPPATIEENRLKVLYFEQPKYCKRDPENKQRFLIIGGGAAG